MLLFSNCKCIHVCKHNFFKLDNHDSLYGWWFGHVWELINITIFTKLGHWLIKYACWFHIPYMLHVVWLYRVFHYDGSEDINSLSRKSRMIIEIPCRTRYNINLRGKQLKVTLTLESLLSYQRTEFCILEYFCRKSIYNNVWSRKKEGLTRHTFQ